jgi:hypothetical protein
LYGEGGLTAPIADTFLKIVDIMNAKLKPVLLILGLVAALLIISQLVMGLLIVKGGGPFELTKLIKSHQHTGYLTVTVALIYILTSLMAIVRVPTPSK